MSEELVTSVTTELEGVRRLIALHEEIEDLEDKLKAAKAERSAIADLVLQDFQRQGVSKTTVNGKTAYLLRQVWANVAEGQFEALKEALLQLNAGDIVKETINTQSLSAFVREFEPDDQGLPGLPAELRGLVKISEKFDIRVRRG